MAWNQPGNNGQDNDPWKKNKKQSSNPSSDPFKKFKEFLGTGSNGSKKQNNNAMTIQPKWLVIILFIIIVVLWFLNGFHTINQSERGVVTRLGKVEKMLAMPGLNWYPPLIDKVYRVDTQGTLSINVKGYMITAGENLVYVEMNVQYRISNPKKYLFSVANVTDSLTQAADSALRSEVGSTNMDAILSDGRAVIEAKTKILLEQTIENYDMGIRIVDLNFQTASPPTEVQASYNDAIKAREDKVSEINKAEADSVQYKQEAEGKAARITAEANAYKITLELEAQGDVERFEQLLPEYQKAPAITKERLYIEMMEKVLSSTRKIIMDEKSNALIISPFNEFNQGSLSSNKLDANILDKSSINVIHDQVMQNKTNPSSSISSTPSSFSATRNGR